MNALIREYEDLCKELENMQKAWDSDDPFNAATSDPGLQYSLGEEIQSKYKEILDFDNIKFSCIMCEKEFIPTENELKEYLDNILHSSEPDICEKCVKSL